MPGHISGRRGEYSLKTWISQNISFFTGEAMRRGQWPDIFGAVSAFFTTQKYTNSQIPQIQNEITGRQEQ